jgi:hypothetical protein
MSTWLGYQLLVHSYLLVGYHEHDTGERLHGFSQELVPS